MSTRTTIRNLDEDAYLEARVYALQTGQPVGQVISDAVVAYIDEDDIDEDHTNE